MIQSCYSSNALLPRLPVVTTFRPFPVKGKEREGVKMVVVLKMAATASVRHSDPDA